MIRKTLLALLLLAGTAHTEAMAQNLRIGLREDPDILDPSLARSYVGRIVFAGLCDKLFDINEKLEIIPQLATGYKWEDPKTLVLTLRPDVTFHDGGKMDAEAVRYSLMRHLTMQGSFRRGEIGSMEAVEVIDPHTVRIKLKQPFAPFLAQLTDRAGMIVSPKAAEAAGKDFGVKPVCAGPFRLVERVAQDRIVLERFPGHWDAGRIHLDRVIYLPITDSTVRLANLQSGALDMVETVPPTDAAAVRKNPKLRLVIGDELGYQGITVNTGNGPRANTPFGRDPRIRRAFELAIDREAVIQVVYEGMYTPTRQAVPPTSPYHIAGLKPEPRDVEKAKALLREAGVSLPLTVEMTVPTSPDLRQAAEVMQAMVGEAGFNLKISAMEFASSLQAAARGDFETYLIGWSGRTDPDGNIWNFLHTGAGQNDGKYSNTELDTLLDRQRETNDLAERRALLEKMWRIEAQDLPIIYLWHRKNTPAMNVRVQGFVPVADGLIRLRDLKLQ